MRALAQSSTSITKRNISSIHIHLSPMKRHSREEPKISLSSFPLLHLLNSQIRFAIPLEKPSKTRKKPYPSLRMNITFLFHLSLEVFSRTKPLVSLSQARDSIRECLGSLLTRSLPLQHRRTSVQDSMSAVSPSQSTTNSSSRRAIKIHSRVSLSKERTLS